MTNDTPGVIQRAAQAAQVDTAIHRLPNGYDTVVGERGLKLSGGEKQRVAIARAVLKDAPILFCDEATSSLDSETEAGIMATMAELADGRTTVFIAHRLSTVQDADVIFVLGEGGVVESGSHEQLLMRHGRYAEMWHRQATETCEHAEEEEEKEKEEEAEGAEKVGKDKA